MIREKGGEDGSRCGYTKEETGEREMWFRTNST